MRDPSAFLDVAIREIKKFFKYKICALFKVKIVFCIVQLGGHAPPFVVGPNLILIQNYIGCQPPLAGSWDKNEATCWKVE